jgi:hypothetical protein
VFSEFGVGDEDGEAMESGYAFSSWAHLGYVYFVDFAYVDWAFASAAFVLGVSWGSFSWANRTFLSLISLQCIISVFHSLSLTHKQPSFSLITKGIICLSAQLAVKNASNRKGISLKSATAAA